MFEYFLYLAVPPSTDWRFCLSCDAVRSDYRQRLSELSVQRKQSIADALSRVSERV